MFIELTPQEVEAIEKWQKYHNEINKGEFYTYQYNGAKLQSTDPVDASHLRDLIKKENKPYSMADELEKAIKEITRPINTETKPETKIENDMVHSPNHYADSAIETIDYIRDKLTQEEFTGLCTGNVLKYTSRWRKKGGIQDLEKALVYLQWAIESEKWDVK